MGCTIGIDHFIDNDLQSARVVRLREQWKPTCEIISVDPTGPLIVRVGGGVDLVVQAAVDRLGSVCLFEGWLEPYLASGALEPVLEPWWQSFTGPFLYYPERRYLPSPLCAFIDFINAR